MLGQISVFSLLKLFLSFTRIDVRNAARAASAAVRGRAAAAAAAALAVSIEHAHPHSFEWQSRFFRGSMGQDPTDKCSRDVRG